MADSGRVVAVAMDGSENANHAFDWYMKNVHKPDDHVVLCHCPEYHAVVHSTMVMTDVQIVADQMEYEHKRVQEFVDKLGEKLKASGIGGKVRSLSGQAGDVILKIAEEEGASMIVTGSRGLGTIRRTFLGSVSDYLIHHSHVPVIVIKHQQEHH